MAKQHCEIGLVGLGVMGRNFLLNMADHGFAVAGYDLDEEKAKALHAEKNADHDVNAVSSLPDFLQLLKRPRAIAMLVPAGKPVDSVIQDLLPHLDDGDLIIDSGNSHFTDTNRRSASLEEKGIVYMGMGMSGGERGARFGPSIMPGGPPEAYERVRPILEAAAAQVQDEPCVTHLGSGSAGHYVKMVHNGIEYGLMQLIGEAYDLLHRGLGLSNDALHSVFDQWSQAELNGFLIEITARIFRKVDDRSGRPLIDMILDQAKQKGTGKWTSWDAMELQVPTPTIDAAVAMRNLSGYKKERELAEQSLQSPVGSFQGDRERFMEQLKNALYASMLTTYAQGMALLGQASAAYHYQLNLEAVARIWRGGCIIRAALLEDIRTAYQSRPDLPNLLLDPHLGRELTARQEDWRNVISKAVSLGVPIPGLMVSQAYFDAYRSSRLPANLIQAQRDYFGSHTYERIDTEGTFHTQWDNT